MTPAKKDLGVELPVWAQVSDKRRGHIVRVTTLLAQWAEVMRIPSEERVAWLDAGVFHDALKDAPDDELYALVGDVAYEPRPQGGARFVVRLPIGGDRA